MREILFRGKRADNGNWVEGWILQTKDGFMIVNLDDYGMLMTHEVIAETIGQYIESKDKNGKKIFEGDIFNFDDEIWSSSYTSCGTEWDSFKTVNYGVVGFDDYYSRFDFVQYKYVDDGSSVEADLHENNNLVFSEFVGRLEVIGNIHDNPELMEDIEEEW